MSESKEKRTFSRSMRSTNSAFLPAEVKPDRPVRVAFVLLENFSLMAFTAAADALVTANLVRNASLFEFAAYGIGSLAVKSDLGICISAEGRLDQLNINEEGPDILIVCGGFRCSLENHGELSRMLKDADKQGILLGGLWNGTVALAHAGLLDGQTCSLHQDNHAYMGEMFENIQVSKQSFLVANNRATSAGAVSALDMMLELISQVKGRETVRAIREILSCDQASESGKTELINPIDDPSYPDSLRELLQVMSSNIEEPLSIEELATVTGGSRRRIERLFHTHMNTSPSRYYLELRITHARRLLVQSRESIVNIAVACGFVSSNHFSRCYKDYFGVSPSAVRMKGTDG